MKVNPPSRQLLDQVIEALNVDRQLNDGISNVQYVVEGWSSKPVTPLQVWIATLKCWVTIDGFSICVAYGNAGQGYYYPTFWQKLRLRRAIKRWQRNSVYVDA